jgi:hypothetical protein
MVMMISSVIMALMMMTLIMEVMMMLIIAIANIFYKNSGSK